MSTSSSTVVRTLFCLLAAIVVAGVSSPPAFAQGPSAEVGAGYAYLIDQDFNLPTGMFADIAVAVSDRTSIVGEFGHSRRTESSFEVPVTLTVNTYQGGVRLVGRMPTVAIYGQVMGGLARFGGSASGGGLDVGVAFNAIAMQFGGGVIVPIGPRVGVRAGGDYRYSVFTDEELTDAKQFRISAGISVGLGQR